EVAELIHSLVEILHRCGHDDPSLCFGRARRARSRAASFEPTGAHRPRPYPLGSARTRGIGRVLSCAHVERRRRTRVAQPATERNAARRAPWWLMIGPGLLLAATGVG